MESSRALAVRRRPATGPGCAVGVVPDMRVSISIKATYLSADSVTTLLAMHRVLYHTAPPGSMACASCSTAVTSWRIGAATGVEVGVQAEVALSANETIEVFTAFADNALSEMVPIHTASDHEM